MSTTIPSYVDDLLREWDFLAFYSYDGFETSGRGVVGILESEQGTSAMYGDRRYFELLGDTRVVGMLDEYDPEQEFLVHFDAAGGTRTLRIRTPEGGRHPKRVWFFEMLRRVNDEPETLPASLPEWFVTACESLATTRNEEAQQAAPSNR
jgi:hypothetical protein